MDKSGFASVLLLVLLCCCKPKPIQAPVPEDPVTTSQCSSRILGYITDSNLYCRFGYIKTSNAALTRLSSLSSNESTSTATWNSSDSCYYVFQISHTSYFKSDRLYKIAINGAITTYSPTGVSGNNIVYNKASNKLYCMYLWQLYEIQISGSTYTLVPVGASTTGYGGAPTVDDRNGNLYYLVVDTALYSFYPICYRYHIKRYNLGATDGVSILSGICGGFQSFLHLKFNNNDNMLYGLQMYSGYAYYFVRINPSTGKIDTLQDIGYVHDRYSSACFNTCTNSYILSTWYDQDKSLLFQLKTNGKSMSKTYIPKMIQGLAATY